MKLEVNKRRIVMKNLELILAACAMAYNGWQLGAVPP